MAAVVSSYSPYVYYQQPYYYPTLPTASYSLPYFNNYHIPQQPLQQFQQQPEQQITPIQYVDSGMDSLRPRRQPRVYREVIRLPTPEPIYRQVRQRMPTPERRVINRTIIRKADGNVIVQQHQAPTIPKSNSRSEVSTRPRQSRPRQIHTD